MNLESALKVLSEDKTVELFNMRFVDGKLEIIILAVEEFFSDSNSISAIFESLNPFETEYINDLDEDVLTINECAGKLDDLVFINKDDVPFFAIGYEAEHILWTIFPDLRDPENVLTKEDEAQFIEQAQARLQVLFSA